MKPVDREEAPEEPTVGKADEGESAPKQAPEEAASSDSDRSDDDAASTPRKRVKRRKGKKRSRTDEAHREHRLGFVQSYPLDAALDPLIHAFDRGDYAFVREKAPLLAAGEAPEAVRAAARDLLRRVAPDRSIVGMMLVALVLLGALAMHFWNHREGEPGKPRPAAPRVERPTQGPPP